jgi:hypothetical protein
MAASLNDEDAGRQILETFARHRVPPSGVLRRNHFFAVRDGDFQRGINRAVQNKWISLHQRDRYRYILTETGYAAVRQAQAFEDSAKLPV